MQSRPTFKFWEEYINHLYQPLQALFMLFYKDQFVEIPEFYSIFVDILLEHHEFMLAAECLTRCSKLRDIDPQELNCYLNQIDQRIIQVVKKARISKNLPSIIDNYDKDSGISESNFQILQEATLEKYSQTFFNQIYYPYGQRADLAESDEEIKDPKDDNFQQYKRQKRLKPPQKKRFSDMVNQNIDSENNHKSQCYIARGNRGNISYESVILAKEYEYLNMFYFGKRAIKQSGCPKRLKLGIFFYRKDRKDEVLREMKFTNNQRYRKIINQKRTSEEEELSKKNTFWPDVSFGINCNSHTKTPTKQGNILNFLTPSDSKKIQISNSKRYLNAPKRVQKTPELNCNLEFLFDKYSQTNNKLKNGYLQQEEDDTRDTVLSHNNQDAFSSASKRTSFSGAFKSPIKKSIKREETGGYRQFY